MKKHLYYYPIAAIFVILLVFFNLNDKKNKSKYLPSISTINQVTPNESSTTLTDSTIRLDKSNQMHSTANDELVDTSPIKKLTEAECDDFFNNIPNDITSDPAYKDYGFWLSDPSTLQNLDYYNYPIDQLEELANNDDRTAQHVLADLIKNTNHSRAIDLYKQAAIRGYIYSLTSLALLINEEPVMNVNVTATSANKESHTADRQARQVESLAWLLVSERAMGRSLEDALQMHTGYKMEPKNLERAKELSGVYLNNLKNGRKKLGLGPFKNRPFPILQMEEKFLDACLSSNNH